MAGERKGDTFFRLEVLFRHFLQIFNHPVKQCVYFLATCHTGYGVDDHGLLAEQFHIESQPGEVIEMFPDQRDLRNHEIKGYRKQ